MTIQHTNHDDFYEWLDKCPVQWVKQVVEFDTPWGSSDDDEIYLFILPDHNDEDEDDDND